MREDTTRRAVARAMHLLEKQDMTEGRLREKLKKSEYSEEDIEEAIAYVKSYHYIDDMRYCLNFIDYNSSSKSRIRIKQDLIKRGADKETIAAAFEESEAIDEESQIMKWLEKKHFVEVADDEKERYRIYSFLMRKGYKTSDILKAMDRAKADY